MSKAPIPSKLVRLVYSLVGMLKQAIQQGQYTNLGPTFIYSKTFLLPLVVNPATDVSTVQGTVNVPVDGAIRNFWIVPDSPNASGAAPNVQLTYLGNGAYSYVTHEPNGRPITSWHPELGSTKRYQGLARFIPVAKADSWDVRISGSNATALNVTIYFEQYRLGVSETLEGQAARG